MNALHFGPRRPPSSRILGHFLNPKSRPLRNGSFASACAGHMIERDILLTHQSRCELRGAVDGDAKIVAPVYTHFDPDGRHVSLAFVISMLSGFVGREGLVNGVIVHGEMPGEKSSAIVTASEALVHGQRVIQCVGATRRIVGRMNSDKCRTHRAMQGTSAIVRRDDVLRGSQFGCTV